MTFEQYFEIQRPWVKYQTRAVVPDAPCNVNSRILFDRRCVLHQALRTGALSPDRVSVPRRRGVPGYSRVRVGSRHRARPGRVCFCREPCVGPCGSGNVDRTRAVSVPRKLVGPLATRFAAYRCDQREEPPVSPTPTTPSALTTPPPLGAPEAKLVSGIVVGPTGDTFARSGHPRLRGQHRRIQR
jgi:hypothetical protein